MRASYSEFVDRMKCTGILEKTRTGYLRSAQFHIFNTCMFVHV
jgi:hypothetical protein